nr:MAG TPA: hypothetical protein [Caudoviricetes sp.]
MPWYYSAGAFFMRSCLIPRINLQLHVMAIAITSKSRVCISQTYNSPTYTALIGKGNCQNSVGRWGLLKQKAALFSEIKPLTP